MVDFNEALKLVIDKTKQTNKTDSVALFDAVGMVLSEDVYCTKPLPAFTNSAMDGYGVKLSSSGQKATIINSVFAGDDIANVVIKEKESIKIMTGAPVPPSVDAVVPFENALGVDGDVVSLPDGLRDKANIRVKGEEADIGELLLKKGSVLTPAAIGLLASQGIFVVKVTAKLKVAVLSSGNEIIEPWQNAGEYQIYNSNASTLMALCKQNGCEAHYVRLISDTYEATVETIKSLKGYDLVLTTGGISMGEADFVGKAFLECGLETIFHKVHIKPGKPTMYGYLGDTVVLALPGNPLSAVVNFYLFGVPAIAKMSGKNACYPEVITAKNANEFSIKTSRANVVLGELKHGKFHVYGANKYGSGMLKPIAFSNAFIITGQSVDRVGEGAEVKAVVIGGALSEEFSDIVIEN
ncbi:MAG: molybdopterin molybdotransferase MoeA [Campylobacterales bacterium]|nr:molybdopterin molybdotransferase MoeA [Campylobacterales bacterium]